MITFRAKYINTAEILRKNSKNTYKPCNTSFIEFNSKNIADVSAIKDAVVKWKSQPNFAESIAENAELDFRMQDDLPITKRRFFAIAEQNDCFEKINPSKILGLLQLSNVSEKCNMIDFVQVNHSGEDLFKHVGSSMLSKIKELFPDKKIILLPASKKLVSFYEKNGFKSVLHSNYMIG